LKLGGLMNSILLVDDEAAICVEFAKTLEGLGFEVEVSPTVEAGLVCIQTARFDAIPVEFNIKSKRNAHPRAGRGLQLVHKIRALKVKAPVIIFTAMEGELYERASLDAGADDFILKTTSIPSLVSRLRAQIRSYRECLGNGTKSKTLSI
jgi:DNA-binding response OmpR family regulator